MYVFQQLEFALVVIFVHKYQHIMIKVWSIILKYKIVVMYMYILYMYTCLCTVHVFVSL